MKSSSLNSMSMVRAALTGALIFMGAGAAHAQLIPGRPAQGSTGTIIGNPPPKQSGTKPIQPNYPATGSTDRSDPVKNKLDRANREAADIDRDGRISPAEASRIPPGTPLPR